MNKFTITNLFPVLLTVLTGFNVLQLKLIKDQALIIEGVRKEVPNITKQSFKTGCIDSLTEFSNLTKTDIVLICEGDAQLYSNPVEQMFDGSN